MQLPQQVLKQYWGYDAFRGEQLNIIQSVLQRKDTLALLPTGGGKSVCFQVPGLMMEGVCIVITPLIALMKDQVENLQQKGIAAIALYSGMPQSQIRLSLRDVAEGKYKFLYLSPERLLSKVFKEYVIDCNVNLVAVDEAHCISQWGYDFRPPYLEIKALRELLPGVPVLAVSASATPVVANDIIEKLQFKGQHVFSQSFVRSNISYSSFRVDSKINKIFEIIGKVQGTGIVYCNTRKNTKMVAELLQQQNISADFYHAGLTLRERERKQSNWKHNHTRVMVCTNAFGMGIDKPDVRFVIHYNLTDCLENYYQEAGRAGRDGKTAFAVLLYQENDRNALMQMPAQRFPGIAEVRKVYQAIVDFLQIPVGIGEGNYYAFDMGLFIQAFKLDIQLVMHAIRVLEQEGFITYNEQVFQSAQVQFTAERDVLNDLDKTMPALSEMARTLLRNYAGVIDSPAHISEMVLAKILKIKPVDVEQQLQQLHQAGVIDYIAKKETPQLYFLTNRASAQELTISERRYFERKKIYEDRVEVMLQYLPAQECRNQYISSYFGDHTTVTCGVCDNCLKRKKTALSAAEFNAIAKSMLLLLQDGPATVNDILWKFAAYRKDNVLTVMEYLQSERKLSAKDGVVSIS
jgi:ATP-dependent DNA helicase RecQ